MLQCWKKPSKFPSWETSDKQLNQSQFDVDLWGKNSPLQWPVGLHQVEGQVSTVDSYHRWLQSDGAVGVGSTILREILDKMVFQRYRLTLPYVTLRIYTHPQSDCLKDCDSVVCSVFLFGIWINTWLKSSSWRVIKTSNVNIKTKKKVHKDIFSFLTPLCFSFSTFSLVMLHSQSHKELQGPPPRYSADWFINSRRLKRCGTVRISNLCWLLLHPQPFWSVCFHSLMGILSNYI